MLTQVISCNCLFSSPLTGTEQNSTVPTPKPRRTKLIIKNQNSKNNKYVICTPGATITYFRLFHKTEKNRSVLLVYSLYIVIIFVYILFDNS